MKKNVKTNDNNNSTNMKSGRAIKRKKRHIILKIILLLLIGLGIFVGIRLYRAGGNVFMAILGHDQHTVETLDKLQVLIMGESTGMSDTLIIASYDPKTQEASMLSIPRDTFTGDKKSSASWYHKINSLYNYGKTPEKTVEAVNKLTGLDLQYYILVDTEALIKLVDTIGGLDYDVPINMNYDDPTQNLHIHLKAGQQTLTGAQVEQLVRFRHNNNGTTYPYSYGMEDHGRNKTQRNVIMEIAKQSLKFKNVKEISNIIDIFKDYVKTNMDLDLVKDYLPYAMEMNTENIKTGIVPGKDEVVNGIWFFFPDEEATKEIVSDFFLDKDPESTEIETDVESQD